MIWIADLLFLFLLCDAYVPGDDALRWVHVLKKRHHPGLTTGTLGVNADDGCTSTNQLRSSEMTTRLDYATWSGTVALAFACRPNTEARMVNISHGRTVQTHRHLCVVTGETWLNPKQRVNHCTWRAFAPKLAIVVLACVLAVCCFEPHAWNPQNANDLSFPNSCKPAGRRCRFLFIVPKKTTTLNSIF